jgi:hypothetical protein
MSGRSTEVQIHAGSYVAGFFDLLGQQDRLRNIRAIPSADDPDGVATLREQIRQSYGVVVDFRKAFTRFFHDFSVSNVGLTGFTEAQRAIYDDYTADDIQIQPMSDSILVYTSVFGPSRKVSFRGIFGILAAAAGSMLACLAAGHPLRGGIDLGIGLVIDKSEFYGPVLARAHTLESRIASYPRIVVGKELINFLHFFANNKDTEIEHQMARGAARSCLDLCADDVDGNTFLDFLGPGVRKHVGRDMDSRIVSAAIQRVFQYHEEAKVAEDQKLGFRYALLSDYCQDRAELWGIKLV